MISYQWFPEVEPADRDEVLNLVTTSAEYDAEAGFSWISPADVSAVGTGGTRISHLVIKARRDLSAREDAPLVIVGYLHLRVDGDGLGTVRFVVHPDYRSRGIATTLVEEVGLRTDAEEGWEGSGAKALRCWAYGTHPASERLTRRFGIDTVARQWTLFRHLSGPFAGPIEPVVLPGDVTLAEAAPLDDPESSRAIGDVLLGAAMGNGHRERLADEIRAGSGSVIVARDGSGRSIGFVWVKPDLASHLGLAAASIRALVTTEEARGSGIGTALTTRALEVLGEAGAQLALMRIDPKDAGAVRMCRMLGFEQEDEHSCYQVGEWATEPGF